MFEYGWLAKTNCFSTCKMGATPETGAVIACLNDKRHGLASTAFQPTVSLWPELGKDRGPLCFACGVHISVGRWLISSLLRPSPFLRIHGLRACFDQHVADGLNSSDTAAGVVQNNLAGWLICPMLRSARRSLAPEQPSAVANLPDLDLRQTR